MQVLKKKQEIVYCDSYKKLEKNEESYKCSEMPVLC